MIDDWIDATDVTRADIMMSVAEGGLVSAIEIGDCAETIVPNCCPPTVPVVLGALKVMSA